MEIFNKKSKIRNKVRLLKSNHQRVAFVPTMGCLHEGHLSLIKQAKEISDIVVVSIFVNPKQFNSSEDLSKYPRQEDQDIELLKNANVDYIFIPECSELFSQHFTIEILENKLSEDLCGITREGHFDGVCLILTKLMNIVEPNYILLGEKDYQQYLITKQLVENLDLDIEVIASPTIREKSGLAMSSRNVRLTDKERLQIAPKLYEVLSEFASKFKNDVSNYKKYQQFYKDELSNLGFSSIEYLKICNCMDLEEYTKLETNNEIYSYRVFVAATIANIRLIDNVSVC